MFTLRFIGTEKLVGFEVNSNSEGEFCAPNEFILTDWEDDPIWVVRSRQIAENAAKYSTQWFNAGFETPNNPFVGHLEVVELSIK